VICTAGEEVFLYRNRNGLPHRGARCASSKPHGGGRTPYQGRFLLLETRLVRVRPERAALSGRGCAGHVLWRGCIAGEGHPIAALSQCHSRKALSPHLAGAVGTDPISVTAALRTCGLSDYIPSRRVIKRQARHIDAGPCTCGLPRTPDPAHQQPVNVDEHGTPRRGVAEHVSGDNDADAAAGLDLSYDCNTALLIRAKSNISSI